MKNILLFLELTWFVIVISIVNNPGKQFFYNRVKPVL